MAWTLSDSHGFSTHLHGYGIMYIAARDAKKTCGWSVHSAQLTDNTSVTPLLSRIRQQACPYKAVSCANGRVVGLNLEGMGLQLPNIPAEIAQLTSLTSLRLMGNPVADATIPKGLERLLDLSLEANVEATHEIPVLIGKMLQLQRL